MKQMRLKLLALLCAALLLLPGCGNGVDPSNHDIPGSSDPNWAASPVESSFVDQEEADAAFDALLQEALAAGEPKQIWAEDFCTEEREEAAVWHCELLNCTELCEEMQKRLLSEAVVKKQSVLPDGERKYELRMGREKPVCTCSQDYLNITSLSSEQAKELLPRAKEWFTEKCGLELREWTGRAGALAVYTACADGLPIAPMARDGGFIWNCGLWGESGAIAAYYPFTLGEQAGAVSLRETFSPEELQMTLEFQFDLSQSRVEAYRSCELCYLLVAEKELLVPVWWVRGTSCSLETGAKAPIELWFDAETGQRYEPAK